MPCAKNSVLAGEIIEKTVRAIQKPVTVKIRSGFDEAHKNAVELARVAQESGAAAVIVHGRTREQFYSGKADWDMIRQVKEAVSVPVIGNGDLRAGKDIEEMHRLTGCDGFMVGRGAQGNPWIFREMLHYLNFHEELPAPSAQEIAAMIKRHAKLLIKLKGEYTGVREMRKHAAWYTSGCRHSAKLRVRINQVEKMEDLLALFEELPSYTGGEDK